MTNERLFEPEEISDAEKRLKKWAPHGISRAVWFYNSLQIFLRDIERRRGPSTPIRLLSCDTTEIVSHVNRSEGSARAFSFAGLITNHEKPGHVGSSDVSLRNLDRLITHHLLFDRHDGHVILDPHLEEVFLIENAINAKKGVIENKFEPYFEQGDISSLSIQHLQRIQEWLSSSDERSQPEEFDRFRDVFLPGWRSEFADHLGQLTKSKNRIRHYIDNAHHYLVAPEHAGEKSVFSLLKKNGLELKWSDFVEFTSLPECRSQFEEIVEVVTRLAAVIPRGHRTGKHIDESTKRDAQSIAILHLFNTFLSEITGEYSRVELITRSQMYHMLMAAVPEDRINVSVRHPLLVPEIYDFDQAALEALGSVFQTVDGALRPILDVFINDPEEQAALSPDTSDQLRAPILQLVELLSDNITVQQTIEKARVEDKTFEDIVINSLPLERLKAGKDNDYQKKVGLARKTADEIRATFEILAKKLRESGDPFSRDAILTIGFHNRKLLDSDSNRVSAEDSTLRLLQFNDIEFNKYPAFVAARLIRGGLPRLFHFYSSRVQGLLLRESGSRAVATDKREVSINNTAVFELAKDAFTNVERLAEQNKRIPIGKDRNDLLYTIEITQLSCMIFAANGLYQTAASLASTILSNVLQGIRKRKKGEGLSIDFWNLGEGGDVRVPLACKELFLLRHYCERAVSFAQLRRGKVSLRTVKGDAVRNLARAQRDLDLAVMMNEEAEQVLLGAFSDKNLPPESSPTGAMYLEDFRFSLIHVSGWIDQFVSLMKRTAQGSSSLSIGWHSEETTALRSRFDIWTAAGLVKDTEFLASKALNKASRTSSEDEKRYLKHVGARAYQNVLTVFVVFLSFDISPDVQSFWNPNVSPNRDRLFAFRNWESWFRSYKEIREEYDFDMRLSDDLCSVCDALIELRELRQVGKTSDFYKRIGRLQLQIETSMAEDLSNGRFSSEVFGVLADRLHGLDHSLKEA